MRQVILITFILAFSHQVFANTSYRLTDTIDIGSGDIDLFNPQDPHVVVTGALLESLRQNANGELIFAVDVNEAASGMEKSTSQGVTVENAVLI